MVERAIGCVLLFAVAWVIIRFDRKIWGSVITPGVGLVFGYAIIATVYFISSLFLELVEIRFGTYLALAGMCTACVIPSLLAAAILKWKPSDFARPSRSNRSSPKTLFVCVALLYVALVVPISLNNGGLLSSGAKDALSSGLIGHLHTLLAFVFVWYCSSHRDRSITHGLLIMLGIVALLLNPVKGWTLIPVVAIVLSSIHRAKASTFSRLLMLVFLGISSVTVFFSIYFSRAFSAGDNISIALLIATNEEIFNHFIFYLTAGFFGLDAILAGLTLNGSADTLFAPILNIAFFLLNEPLTKIVSDIYVPGFVGKTDGGNVFSFFGTILGYAGIYLGIALSFLFLLVGYLFTGALWRSRIPQLRAVSLYGSAIFAFAWFEFYFWHLTPLEFLFCGILFSARALAGRTFTHKRRTKYTNRLCGRRSERTSPDGQRPLGSRETPSQVSIQT